MKLLMPITIRGMEFKNRAVMPPMQVGVGVRSRKARAYYLERAKGGVGTIILAATSVGVFASDDIWGRKGGVDAFIDGIHPLIDDIHQTGTRIGIQLWHGNRLPAGIGLQNTGGEAVAPSTTARERQLTIPEIKLIISRFAQAASNVRRAGFDFVEVHGAHGYLVCQFFSPATNERSDEYGGDLAGRMRFGTECVSAMRSAVGDDYPIFYRLGAWENIPNGITVEDSAQFAVRLEKTGADVIDVSLGRTTGSGGATASPGPEQPEGTFAPLVEAIKRAVKVPVIAVGRFRTPQVVEEVLAQGKADMVAIGRQLIADPHWLEKAATGRTEDIIPCISCNVCFESGLAGLGLKCSVNAVSGRESELTVEPALRPKRVMVVGGGPAGMEAARVAALRGHEVVLYERQNELGGQLTVAAVPPYKHELALLNRYLIHQLEKTNVQVKLGVEVTPELVEKEKPDTVILAAGAMPLIPEIPGMNKCQKATAADVLSGTVDVGEKVVVIGGELVGCETADFLSQEGKKVTVVRRGPEMASKMYPSNRHALLARLKEKDVVLITGVKEYEAITQEGLVIIDSEGNRQTLECDTIVLAAGAISNDQMAKALEGKVGEIRLAGDCVQPRRIVDAIHEGARLGREI